MSDWDGDGPQLFANLREAHRLVTEHARARQPITLADMKAWHRTTMRGLDIDDAARLGVDPSSLIGEFRGPPKLPGIEVRIGSHTGVPSAEVAQACKKFIGTLQALIRALDKRLVVEKLDEIDEDGLRAVAEAAAWAHAEWVRIHPFANGNGRTARLLGNTILVRYGLPPVFRLRPRPDGSYAVAASLTLTGDHRPMGEYVIAQIMREFGGPPAGA